jgi:hypothetical protein
MYLDLYSMMNIHFAVMVSKPNNKVAAMKCQSAGFDSHGRGSRFELQIGLSEAGYIRLTETDQCPDLSGMGSQN